MTAPERGRQQRPLVVDRWTHASLEDLARDRYGLRRLVPAGGAVELRSSRGLVVAAAAALLQGWASRVDLIGSLPLDVAPGAVVVGDEVTARDIGEDPGPPGTPVATQWTLYTSGTTGTPKAVTHTFGSLTRTTRRHPGARPFTWGLLYDATRMAGVQVVLQALAADDTLVDATGWDTITERVRWLSDHRVDALSATPTLWRQILQTPDHSDLRLRQVTLGGEIADDLVLRALRSAFPQARITHVYASTETGAAFGVSDGRAGFPASYLTAPPGQVALDVRDGVLHVHSPEASEAGPDGFASTGDLVEVVDDRVLFKGRASGVVNVGGVKVWPEEVENVIREHPGVADAVVIPKRSPISGWILTAEVVAGARESTPELGAAVRSFCAARLGRAQVPAKIRVVDALPTSATGKARR